MTNLALTVEEALSHVPIMDAHTHLVGGKLGARGLHDIALYHMVISDLHAAGCPSGRRLSEFPRWADKVEAHARLSEAIPYLPLIRNTSCHWAMKTILADLYGWTAPITVDNWKKLDDLIRERADDTVWHHQILDRSGIARTCAEYARRGDGESDDRLQYSLEWGMFMRCQWGEFDTALFELERAWGGKPEDGASPIGAGKRMVPQRTIRSVDDVYAALDHYVASIPTQYVTSMAMHLSTDIDYELPTAGAFEEALQRRSTAGSRERDIYAAFVAEELFKRLEAMPKPIVFQFSFAAEPLPFETASRINQKTLAQLAELLARHPKLQFQSFSASLHADQTLCTLCRELPNLSLAGYWWHSFFPQTIRSLISQRLDMLPVNRQVGFFSDAYVAEWAYAKVLLVRKQLAAVLAEKIEQGQYSFDEALSISQSILFETASDLLGMTPHAGANIQ